MTDDEEVMAWWKAVKEEGHPDTKEGWPVLDSVAALQDILASIMWVSSGHHAGVCIFRSCLPLVSHASDGCCNISPKNNRYGNHFIDSTNLLVGVFFFLDKTP